MVRFSSEDHLVRWRETGSFPAIHDDIRAMVSARAPAKPLLDLCCSTGLLGESLAAEGFTVFGVDCNGKTIRLGVSSGVKMPMTAMTLRVDNWGMLAEFIALRGIVTIVARRCIPELFTHAREQLHAERFVSMVALAGIEHVFLEGRIRTPRAVHPLRSVDREVAIFEKRYRVAYQQGNVVHLMKKTPGAPGAVLTLK